MQRVPVSKRLANTRPAFSYKAIRQDRAHLPNPNPCLPVCSTKARIAVCSNHNVIRSYACPPRLHMLTSLCCWFLLIGVSRMQTSLRRYVPPTNPRYNKFLLCCPHRLTLVRKQASPGSRRAPWPRTADRVGVSFAHSHVFLCLSRFTNLTGSCCTSHTASTRRRLAVSTSPISSRQVSTDPTPLWSNPPFATIAHSSMPCKPHVCCHRTPFTVRYCVQ